MLRALLGSNLQIVLNLIAVGLAIVGILFIREANYALLSLSENTTLYELWDAILLELYAIPTALLSLWVFRLANKYS